MIKKILIAVVLVVALASYILFRGSSKKPDIVETTPPPATASTNTTTTDTTTTDNSTNSTSNSNSNTTTTTTSGQYKDGAYTGTVADAYYGPLQVRAIISRGKLTDVQFLQYPNDQTHSIEVNTYSNPRLRQEAISVQSANVNIISGATQSSEAFRESLGAALGQAHS